MPDAPAPLQSVGSCAVGYTVPETSHDLLDALPPTAWQLRQAYPGCMSADFVLPCVQCWPLVHWTGVAYSAASAGSTPASGVVPPLDELLVEPPLEELLPVFCPDGFAGARSASGSYPGA